MRISRVLRTLRWCVESLRKVNAEQIYLLCWTEAKLHEGEARIFGDAVMRQATINFAILFFIIKFVRLLNRVLRTLRLND